MAKRVRAVRGLGTVSMDDLQAEMRRRQRGVSGLQKRYQRAAAKAANLARQIEALGGSIDGSVSGRGGGRGSRPRNEKPLSEYLVEAVKGKELGIPAIVEAVQKLGYRSNASSFRSIVSIALAKTPGIKRVGRGVYAAK